MYLNTVTILIYNIKIEIGKFCKYLPKFKRWISKYHYLGFSFNLQIEKFLIVILYLNTEIQNINITVVKYGIEYKSL